MREEWFGKEVVGEIELSPLQWSDSISLLEQDVQSLLPIGGFVIVDSSSAAYSRSFDQAAKDV